MQHEELSVQRTTSVDRVDRVDRKDEDRSIGELFGELAREMSTLVRQEAQLAKTEISDKASEVGKDVGFLVAGGAIAYGGFLVILAAITIMLAGIIPLWLSALLVGIVVAGIGYGLAQKGISGLKKVDLKPRETVESLKEDQQFIKEQVK